MEGEAKSGASILIAEDEGSVARAVASRLEPEGHKVRWVRTIREARTELRDDPADLVLIDSALETDGLEYFQALRFAPEAPRGGIIVLAEQSDVRKREHAQQLGAAAVVSKPVQGDELAVMLRDLIRHL
ncbi:MAG TPA: response regulator [Candidatus Dormibacteraeota bacterium]|jgi:two-component system catabolic regulation response regulator CreB|nr:response regulator [Candidatus Dormibacteraeota bacterium]